MVRAGHEQVDFFVGTEVEHTPAFGRKTLFVVGVQDTSKINILKKDIARIKTILTEKVKKGN